jgi:hypothetical protein
VEKRVLLHAALAMLEIIDIATGAITESRKVFPYAK